MPLQHSGPERSIVSSWKEIASHFGVTVRTVQLWEAERGLPVHRMPGVKGRVYAYEEELDTWAAGRLSRPDVTEEAKVNDEPARRKSHLAIWLAALGLLALAVVLTAWFKRPDPEVGSVRIDGRTLTALNRDEDPLWRHEFPEPVVGRWQLAGDVSDFPQTRPWIGDLDGDGKREVLFTYATNLQQANSELFCFDSGGRVRWRYKPGREVRSRKEGFPPPYFIRSVMVVESAKGRSPVLLVAGNHGFAYASQIVALSAEGKVVREYWHSGHIAAAAAADLNRDGRPEVYLTAAHNATQSVAVIALDPEDFGGASHEENPDYQLLDLGPARELGRIILPRSEISRRMHEPAFNGEVAVRPGRISVAVDQFWPQREAPGRAQVVFEFGGGLGLLGVDFDSKFRLVYEEMVRRRRIEAYDLQADLERLKRVTVVTPWRDVKRR